MSFTQWLANDLRPSPQRASRTNTLAARALFRPVLETLERRQFMSATAIGYLGGGSSPVLATVTNATVTLTTPYPGGPIYPGEPVYPGNPIVSGQPIYPSGPVFGMIRAIGSQIIT